MNKIKIGISGYGNVGEKVEYVITKLHKDMELKAIFSKRNIKINSNAKLINKDFIFNWAKKLDVLILCDGSKKTLPILSPKMALHFNTIDSYDDHSNMAKYYNNLNKMAKRGKNLAIFATGWDPGKFSKERIEAESYYPDGQIKSFWGDGVSQGHTNVIKEFNTIFKKNWILDAIQYTHPIDDAIMLAREGRAFDLALKEQHWRECYISVANDADKELIKNWLLKIPGYFEPYNTAIKFVPLEEIIKRKQNMYHKGLVITYAKSSDGKPQKTEYKLDIASNPEHTARILVSHARANYRLKKEGMIGAIPAICVPVDKLHHDSLKTLIKNKV